MLSYAEMAEWEQGHDVNIAADEGKSWMKTAAKKLDWARQYRILQ